MQAAKTGPSAAAAPAAVAPAIAPDLALAHKLAERPAPAKPGRHADREEKDRARRKIIREVEDARQRDPDASVAASLNDEILDRLDSPDRDDDDDDRPIAEIIADICLDLGLETPLGLHPAKRPTQADIKPVSTRPRTPRPTSPSAPGAVPPRTRTGSDPPL